jgi:hypothetical protein
MPVPPMVELLPNILGQLPAAARSRVAHRRKQSARDAGDRSTGGAALQEISWARRLGKAALEGGQALAA